MGERGKRTPPTQALRPELFVDQDTLHPPLTQQVPAEAQLLASKVTNATIKAVAEAAARATEHADDPKAGLLGYGAPVWRAIHTRVARGLRVKRATLDDENKAAVNRRHQFWQSEADKIWKKQPGLTKEEVAAQIVARKDDPDEPGTVGWIKRVIRKK